MRCRYRRLVHLSEQPAKFGPERSLIGVLGRGRSRLDPSRPAVVFLNAGSLHSVGPHRLNVDLARHLSSHGFPTLRFDLRGLGNSRKTPFEQPDDARAPEDVSAALDWLCSEVGASSFVLVGLCRGATTAFRSGLVDPRVQGLVLINGTYPIAPPNDVPVGAPKLRARARYYGQQLRDWESWGRLLTGKSNLPALLRFMYRWPRHLLQSSHSDPDGETEAAWESLLERTRVLLVFAEGSDSLDAYRLGLEKVVGKLSPHPNLQLRFFESADHTFTPLASQRALIGSVSDWLAEGL